jgi:hypothetical protein
MSLHAKFAAVLICFSLVWSVPVRAMGLEAFGRLNNDDEATFVTLLVEAAAQKFKAQGQPDQAAKVIAYFKVPGRDGGAQQFASHVQAMYATNKLHATNPNNKVPELQIEDAMAVTLREQGFDVPVKYLLASGKTFKPVGPPRAHIGM